MSMRNVTLSVNIGLESYTVIRCIREEDNGIKKVVCEREVNNDMPLDEQIATAIIDSEADFASVVVNYRLCDAIEGDKNDI